MKTPDRRSFQILSRLILGLPPPAPTALPVSSTRRRPASATPLLPGSGRRREDGIRPWPAPGTTPASALPL